MARLSDVWMDTFDRAKVEEVPTYSWSPQGTVTLSANCCNSSAMDSLCSTTTAIHNEPDVLTIRGDNIRFETKAGVSTLQDKFEELAGAIKKLEIRLDEKYGGIPKNEIQNGLVTGSISRLTRSGLRLI